MVQSFAEKPLVALQAVLQRMREERDPRQLTQMTLDYVQSIFAAPLIWMALYDPVNHRLVGQGGVTTQEESSFLNMTQPLGPGEFLEQVVIEQRPLGVPDMSREPRMGTWQKEAKRLDIQGCLMYPIRHAKRCMGVLMLGSQLWGVTTTDEEQALVMILLEHLAASLHTIETSWKQEAQRRIEEPLLLLGTAMRSMNTMEERVEAIVSQLQVFTGINRVNVYWLDREQSLFIQRWTTATTNPASRAGNPLLGREKGGGPKIVSFPSRDLGDLYYSLVDGQTIAVSEAGSTRSEIPIKLMQQLKAQSMMVAPLLIQGDLYGFLAIEADQAHQWLDEDRRLLTGSAALLSLSIPVAEREALLTRLENDQGAIHRLAQTIYTEDGLQQTIAKAATMLCEQLRATACLILVHEPSTNTFAQIYEHRLEGKKTFPKRLRPLSENDWDELLKCRDAITTDNYQHDIRFSSWRNELVEAGVKSLVVAHTARDQTHGIEGIVLIIHQSLRYWNLEERQLVRSVGVQLGLVMRQWQLDQAQQRMYELLQHLATGVMSLQAAHTLPDLYQQTTKQLAQLLKVPLAVVVTCLPGEVKAHVQAVQSVSQDFALTGTTEFDAEQDPLFFHCLNSPDSLAVEVADLPTVSSLWLNATGIGQILMLPLGFSRMDALAPLGMVLVADGPDRVWREEERWALEVISSTSGAGIRRLQWTQTLQERREVLTELNWYKHRRLFDAQAVIIENLRRLGQAADTSNPDQQARWQKVVEVGQSFRDLVTPLQQVLKQETWAVNPLSERIPVATLIRRSLQRLETLVQKRKLWPRVQGDTAVAVQADPGRLEMVLYEVLVAAIQRSQEGGNLEIWVQNSHGYMELSIVDMGYWDPQLIAALSTDPQLAVYADPSSKSPLTFSPGLELSLCQRLVARMTGELMFYQVPDGRNVSRLVLPLVESPEIDAAGTPEIRPA